MNFRYLYCFGLGVLACGSMKALTEIRKYLDLTVDSMLLHSNYKDKIIVDINNNFDYKINDVFEVLNNKEKQYCFTADLYKIGNQSLWAQSFCEGIIETYLQVFGFTKEERRFFKEFIEFAERQEKERAMEQYQLFLNEGYQISYKLIQYMYPDFLMEEVLENLILEKGSKRILDKPTVIKGNLIVRNGASLIIDGAVIKIEGAFFVQNGKINIKNSEIICTGCKEEYIFQLRDTSSVQIEDTKIDANFFAGIIKQDSGYLVLNNNTLQNSRNKRAINFAGKSLVMNGVTLQDCLDGGICNLADSEVSIDDCSFYHCVAEQGGAIYSDSFENVSISNCSFVNCSAKYIGGAVYFTYKKFGQNVNNCSLQKCIPEDSCIFNAYESI